jgi:DNA-binding NtrC family response regulator
MVILAEGPILTKNDLPPRLLTAVREKEYLLVDVEDNPSEDPDRPFGGDFASLPGATLESRGRPSLVGSDLEEASSEENDDDLDSLVTPQTGDYQNLPQPSTALDTGYVEELKKLEFWPIIAPLFQFPSQGLELQSLLNQYEERLVRSALAAHCGVKNQAARALGINRTTFLEKLKKKGLDWSE